MSSRQPSSVASFEVSIESERSSRAAISVLLGLVRGCLPGDIRLLTASRPDSKSAGNGAERIAARRDEPAGHRALCLVETRVRFPAAPPEGPQIRLVSRSRTCRRRFQARASLRYIRSWRCHCGGDNPSRTCDAAKVSVRAAERPVPRRIPALSGRTSAHRATAPSAFGPRRLPRRVAPAISPQKKPRRKNLRARRLFSAQQLMR
jgi:hypothetical protein